MVDIKQQLNKLSVMIFPALKLVVLSVVELSGSLYSEMDAFRAWNTSEKQLQTLLQITLVCVIACSNLLLQFW